MQTLRGALIETGTYIDLDALKEWLGGRLSSERYSHSLGAQDKALDLAERFQFTKADYDKAAIASLLHDAAKLMNSQELIQYCDAHDIVLSDEDRQSPQTLHPFVGAEMVKETFGITDEDVLNAIRYHTTGRPGMTLVEKVVFIADKIESNTRNPLYIQKVTALLDYRNPRSLDETMCYLLDSTITFLIEKRQVIHPRTIEARNDFILRLRRKANPTSQPLHQPL